jgi:hypothetical protein
VRIDAGSGQIVARRPWPYPPEEPGALAAADRGVWIERGCDPLHGGVVDRLDPAGAVTTRVALTTPDGLATAAANLWVLGHDGTLTQIDAAGGGIRQRWPRLAPLSDPNTWGTKALIADGAGVWVLSTGRAALLRVERGRVAQRIAVDPSARPLLAKASDGLWIATADRLGNDNRLIRLNPHTRRPTATVKLGHQRPVALLPAGGEMYVVTSDGKVLVIGS